MLPEDETFIRYYSLAGLYERLREDAALYPDTMDQRYGAWPQLLVIFRMIHDGAELKNGETPTSHWLRSIGRSCFLRCLTEKNPDLM